MSKRDDVKMSLKKYHLNTGNKRISIEKVHNILFKNNIIEGWRRKDFIKWMEANLFLVNREGELYTLGADIVTADKPKELDPKIVEEAEKEVKELHQSIQTNPKE